MMFVLLNLSAQRFIVKTIYESHTSPGLPFLVESSISMCQTAGMESYWITEICGKICFNRIFFILGEISTSMKFFHRDFYTSFKQTVQPSDFENKLLPSQQTFSYRQGTKQDEI